MYVLTSAPSSRMMLRTNGLRALPTCYTGPRTLLATCYLLLATCYLLQNYKGTIVHRPQSIPILSFNFSTTVTKQINIIIN